MSPDHILHHDHWDVHSYSICSLNTKYNIIYRFNERRSTHGVYYVDIYNILCVEDTTNTGAMLCKQQISKPFDSVLFFVHPVRKLKPSHPSKPFISVGIKKFNNTLKGMAGYVPGFKSCNKFLLFLFLTQFLQTLIQGDSYILLRSELHSTQKTT